MLILTRRIGETLCIGDQVAVTVPGIKGQQVRLAIDAPKEIIVLREEPVEQYAAQRGVAPGVQA